MPKFDAGLESMVDTFVFETSDLLEKLDEILMRTEKEDTIEADDINEIFRIMHTIKGSAAMMGLQNMSSLAHSVEDLFYIIRDNPKVSYDKAGLYELLFSSSDNLKNETDNIQDEAVPLTDFTELIEKIHSFADKMKNNLSSENGKSAETVSTSDLFPDDEKDNVLTYKVTYTDNCAMPSARGMVLLRAVSKNSELIRTIPDNLDDDNADDIIKANGLFIKLITDESGKDRILNILKNGINVSSVELIPKPEKKSVEVKEKKTDNTNPTEKAQKAAPPAQKHEQSIISVKLDKLNHLLDLVAEIVITESSVTASPDLKQVSSNLDRFNKSSRELKKLTDELQDVVMSIRMVPIMTAFQKMNRVVRDMNNKLKKDVNLVFVGDETEVDKSIVDILNDPLMHIVRNAVDHGIETPQERKAAGKTDKPTVTLSAGYDSNEVIISCSDNGAGMDTEKLMAKAKKNGMLTKPENEYTEQEIFNFVIAAGFSTNEKVTEFSGRGVGMDVVKKNIEKVGGKLSVQSKLGEGSTFIIKIPLSLSILDVLSVDVGKSNFSIPVASIREAFCCKAENYICDTDNNEFIMLRDKCLPLIRLSKHFDVVDSENDICKGIMLYCQQDGFEAVIMADRITVDQQVVVKPFSPILAPYHLKETGLAGCAILGDGSITIILDMKEIISDELK